MTRGGYFRRKPIATVDPSLIESEYEDAVIGKYLQARGIQDPVMVNDDDTFWYEFWDSGLQAFTDTNKQELMDLRKAIVEKHFDSCVSTTKQAEIKPIDLTDSAHIMFCVR